MPKELAWSQGLLLHRATLRLAEGGEAIRQSDLRLLQRGGQPKTEGLTVIPFRRPRHQDGAFSPQITGGFVLVLCARSKPDHERHVVSNVATLQRQPLCMVDSADDFRD